MLPHHAETIQRTTAHFAADPAVIGLLLAGSLAHGFANPDSDVDVMIVVSDEDHRERMRTGRTCFFSRELCTYPEGYVDGKYTAQAFLEQVRDKGSEPARFAFKDAQVLFSRNPALAPLLAEAARYPVADKPARLWRFQAQFEAWFWYTGEARKRHNLPLLRTAISKLTLFGGRIVLAHNELLYPFHKWFLRVLASAPEKPVGLLAQIERLAALPLVPPDRSGVVSVAPHPPGGSDEAWTDARDAIEEFARSIREFRPWEISHATWPAQFMEDSEVNWLRQPAPVDDI